MSAQAYTLFDLVERGLALHPGRTALIAEDGQALSFADLHAAVERQAAALAAAGLEPGDRICVLAWNSAAYFTLLLACVRQGVVAAPLNWRLSGEELQRLLARTAPKAVLADAQNAPALPGEGAARSGDLAGIAHWLLLDAGPVPAFSPLAALGEGAPEPPRPDVGADDPAVIIATAAVDVIPRGAVLSHANLLGANLQLIAALGLTPADGNLLALPLFHIAGLGTALAFLHAGAKNAVMPRYDASQAVTLIDRHGLTHLGDFPPILASLLDAAQSAESALPSLRVVSGLDAPDTIRRLHETTRATFWTGFGQTETSGFASLQNAREGLGSAGHPGLLSALRLEDEAGQPVPAGQPGEICVRGPLVFLGYDGLPEVTAQTFRGGWHHTGDVGRIEADGRLTYLKRKPEKELIKSGGENVYPSEVEAVIYELPQVTGVCVFGVPDEQWGESVMAVVEAGKGPLQGQAVIDHVGERIARFKRPRHVAFTKTLPRDETGSIDREAVKQQYAG